MLNVSHKAVTVWRISNFIFTGLLLVILCIVFAAKKLWFTFIPWWIIGIIALLIIFQFIWFVLIEPVLAYRYFCYEVKNEEVIITRGIFIRRTIVIPLVRIQNITISVGPIMKKFGLKTVVITTAGGSETIQLIDDEQAAAVKRKIDVTVKTLERRRMDDRRDRDGCY